MKLSLDALRTLEAIVEYGSFAGAAGALHRVPSALTYTIQKLEADLGVRLFERSGRRAEPTAVGRALVEEARGLLRQAERVESRIKRLSEGWEAELAVAVDGLVPMEWLFPMVEDFDRHGASTRLRLMQELIGGPWDALIDRRVDVAVAAGETPSGYGLTSRVIGEIEWVYVLAAKHVLADAEEPLTESVLLEHRAVVVADSSRRLSVGTSGVHPGQPTLTVSTLEHKIAAQIRGLGGGFLPLHLARAHIEAGRLRHKAVETPREPLTLRVAWRDSEAGRGVQWIREWLLHSGDLCSRLREFSS
ncbi:LysR substrate-binding domain-containing protein [Algiphilus sp. W345]|uniref:LysR substrate-binding domain-containing protein n=1 Tax=Banduia mediterranea TaxID=3075609 RepID=A0ABU2WEM7_9GAMM|nr:LysR substrate-binding domain-containing protein [Algiphilus sp. W345]MDT0495988.1 LysR substrate-binding domain-containing protein [Algiphilus sp. W345]